MKDSLFYYYFLFHPLNAYIPKGFVQKLQVVSLMLGNLFFFLSVFIFVLQKCLV